MSTDTPAQKIELKTVLISVKNDVDLLKSLIKSMSSDVENLKAQKTNTENLKAQYTNFVDTYNKNSNLIKQMQDEHATKFADIDNIKKHIDDIKKSLEF